MGLLGIFNNEAVIPSPGQSITDQIVLGCYELIFHKSPGRPRLGCHGKAHNQYHCDVQALGLKLKEVFKGRRYTDEPTCERYLPVQSRARTLVLSLTS